MAQIVHAARMGIARHLDVDELIVDNNGKIVKFSKGQLNKIKNGGKGWKCPC
ncbi:hypothetical protein C163_17505 [Pseudomonas sp. FGI182]|uniref:hypothetical protein n=1 Tax=Pseudomonas sp. FGI182 TaxID=1259844 RepID=UPI0003D8573F|nr:hypothetical protein [Pseudomonas sp. FGI182]AHD17286.1 hypothetical protein C163_17505 [Pseudomonas sp. FGI182]